MNIEKLVINAKQWRIKRLINARRAALRADRVHGENSKQANKAWYKYIDIKYTV